MNKRTAIILLVAVLLAVGGWLFWQTKAGERTQASLRENASYFDILRYVQERIRSNPDHLPARYQQIINTGEAQDLIEFIKTRFDVVPPPTGWYSSVNYINWGEYGALNGGLGTPRELAELLASGLRRMGYEAEIISLGRQSVPQRPRKTAFDKRDFARIDWSDIKQRTGGKPMSALPPERHYPDLWHRVAAAIPSDFEGQQRLVHVENITLPSVRFRKKTAEQAHGAEDNADKRQTENDWKVANLWGEDTALVMEGQRSIIAGARSRPRMVKLELLVKTSRNRWHRLDKLLQAEFKEEALAGSVINVGFAPLIGSPEAVFTTRPSQVSRFQPFIKVSGDNPGLDEDERKVFGDFISLRGEVGRFTEDDKLVFGDKILTHGGDAGRVTRLEIREADVSRYPWIEVRFDPLDQQNNVVTGLAQSAFTASLDGQNVLLQLQTNTHSQPKIIFLIDGSTSVAPEYRADKLHDIVLNMTKEIKKTYPKALFKVMGDSPNVITREWSDDAEFIAKKASSSGLTSNYMWRSVIAAAKMEADAIVYFNDGNDVDHEIQPRSRKLGEGVGYEDLPMNYKIGLAAAPPVFTLGGERLPEHPLGPAFEGIAKATNGKAFNITNHDEAVKAIMDELQARLGVYRGFVRAESNTTRKTTVLKLVINGVDEEIELEIPDKAWRHKPPSSVQGIYLRVSRRGVSSSLHRLAGAAFGTQVTEQDEHNARLGMFGRYALIAQAGTPSASQMLDAAISERLSLEQVLSAKTVDEKLQALAKASTLARSQFSYALPLSGVYDKGLRYWLDIEQRMLIDGQEKQVWRTDILPFSFYADASDKKAAFEQVFQASASINEREANLHQSDMSCLDGQLELKLFYEIKQPRRAMVERIQGGQNYNYPVIVPLSQDIRCLIELNRASGAVLFKTEFGGAGLTVAEVEARFDQVNALLDAAGELGGAIAAWAALEQAKMEKLRMATIMILTMEPPDIEGMIRDEVCERISGGVDGVVEGGIGRIGGTVAEVWEIIGDVSDIGEALGFGGFDTSVPIPGCE